MGYVLGSKMLQRSWWNPTGMSPSRTEVRLRTESLMLESAPQSQTFCDLEMGAVPGPNTESQVHRLGTYCYHCRCFGFDVACDVAPCSKNARRVLKIVTCPTSKDHA